MALTSIDVFRPYLPIIGIDMLTAAYNMNISHKVHCEAIKLISSKRSKRGCRDLGSLIIFLKYEYVLIHCISFIELGECKESGHLPPSPRQFDE